MFTNWLSGGESGGALICRIHYGRFQATKHITEHEVREKSAQLVLTTSGSWPQHTMIA